MAELNCISDEVVLIDDADFDWLMPLTWYYNARDNSVSTVIQGGTIYLGRLIGDKLGFDSELEVDHKNTNGLDNRRENLRPATRSENAANRNIQSNNTSGYKGVRWNPRTQKWAARTKHKGQEIYLGQFATDRLVALAYNSAVRHLFGDFARVNEVQNG